MADRRTPSTSEEIMADLLRSVGVDSYEPRLLAAMAECAKRYTAEVLADAKDYSVHRKQHNIGEADLKIALQTHPSARGQIQRQELKDKAADVNRQELPPIPQMAGICEPVVAGHFTTRSMTLIPGSEAFGPREPEQIPMNISSSHGSSSSSKRIKITLGS